MFKLGDEVLCVDDEIHYDIQDARGGLDGLKQGEKYHIRWVGQDVTKGVTRWVCRLVEIYREPLHGPGSGSDEAVYYCFRFRRPLTISKTTERKAPTQLEDA